MTAARPVGRCSADNAGLEVEVTANAGGLEQLHRSAVDIDDRFAFPIVQEDGDRCGLDTVGIKPQLDLLPAVGIGQLDVCATVSTRRNSQIVAVGILFLTGDHHAQVAVAGHLVCLDVERQMIRSIRLRQDAGRRRDTEVAAGINDRIVRDHTAEALRAVKAELILVIVEVAGALVVDGFPRCKIAIGEITVLVDDQQIAQTVGIVAVLGTHAQHDLALILGVVVIGKFKIMYIGYVGNL